MTMENPWDKYDTEGGFGDSEEVTPYKGLSLTELAAMYKEGRLSESDYRAELKGRKTGEKAVEELVNKNAPDPNAPKPSAIKPPTMEGGAGLKDYTGLSETDIINKYKKGEWTQQEAENALVASKGYSLGSARETLGPVAAEVAKSTPTAEQSAAARALEARGITSKLSVADIIKGAEQGLWSPDEAYSALINLKEYSATEAATTLRLKGWQGGPGGTGVAAVPPPARSAGELMSRYNVASSPGDLMARAAQPQQSTPAGSWAMPGSTSGSSAGLKSVSGVQHPTIQGHVRTSASGKGVTTPSPSSSRSSGGMVRAEDGSMVPSSYYGKTDMTPIPQSVLQAAKAIAASGKTPPPYTPGQPYPPPGWSSASAGLASVAG